MELLLVVQAHYSLISLSQIKLCNQWETLVFNLTKIRNNFFNFYPKEKKFWINEIENQKRFGIVPGAPLEVRTPLLANTSAETSLPLTFSPIHVQVKDPINLLQIAVKNNVSVFYFQTNLHLHILFPEVSFLSFFSFFFFFHFSSKNFHFFFLEWRSWKIWIFEIMEGNPWNKRKKNRNFKS